MDSKKFLKILGEKIRAVRKAKKISQEKLAELAGIHPTYISDIERGKVNASIYTFYVVTQALDFPSLELVSSFSEKVDKQIEAEIAEMLALLRSLAKKKQVVFLSATKGLVSSIEKMSIALSSQTKLLFYLLFRI